MASKTFLAFVLLGFLAAANATSLARLCAFMTNEAKRTTLVECINKAESFPSAIKDEMYRCMHDAHREDFAAYLQEACDHKEDFGATAQQCIYGPNNLAPDITAEQLHTFHECLGITDHSGHGGDHHGDGHEGGDHHGGDHHGDDHHGGDHHGDDHKGDDHHGDDHHGDDHHA